MKTKFILLTLFSSFLMLAQDRTTVTAADADISDNLDLRAIASIFGDSRDLEEFERKLNDPKMQISNLDLNRDNQVDYLRVLESVETNTHLIIIQAILDKDIYQDVATVEVEKDGNNQVQVQVVGDTYLYGNNYIYEPVYIRSPIIYDYFWTNNYVPYYSSWNYGFYPSYFYAWNPYPVYHYRNNVNVYINNYNTYNYVNVRRSQRAQTLYNTRRSNGYEVRNPNGSFAQRNESVRNRYELVQQREKQNPSVRSNAAGNVSSASVRSSAPAASNSANATRRSSTPSTSAKKPLYTGAKRSSTPVSATRSSSTRSSSTTVKPRSTSTNSAATRATQSPSNVRSQTVRSNSSSISTPRPASAASQRAISTPARTAPQQVQTPRASSPAPSMQQSRSQSAPAAARGSSNAPARSSQGSGRR